MDLWVVLDNLSNEPEIFANKKDAVAFALEILEGYQERWRFEQEEYETSCSEIRDGNDAYDCWGTYLGECEVNIFKKFI